MRPGKFDGLADRRPAAVVPDVSPPARPTSSARPSRDGKKVISGHYTPELSRALALIAVEEGGSVQALLGEAIDLLLRSRGKHPFGER